MKKISIVTSCYNEEDNILTFYSAIKNIADKYNGKYNFEFIFVDNASNDFTVDELQKICSIDKRCKVIINSRNFGCIRSAYHGIMQTSGDCTIYLACDMQDPPALISEFIENWENGCEIVIAKRYDTNNFSFINTLRKIYYFLLDLMKESETKLVRNYTGFGLYDKKVISKLKETDDPYPYFRGAVLELGYSMKIIQFERPKRNAGEDKKGLITLWDNGMLGLTRTTKIPVHIITMTGFFGTLITFILIMLSLACYVGYLNFIIPKKMLSLYFLMFVQILSVGLIGEYVIMLCRFAEKKPLVVEKERINFN